MGLDMYLEKKSYVKNWNSMDESKQHKVTVLLGGKERTDIRAERISYITEEVAYWRKFNALHGWFIENVVDGKDDCREVHVDIDQLIELNNTLKEVLDALNVAPTKQVRVVMGWQGNEKIYQTIDVYDCPKALELLPPCEGFFFGSQEIGSYYKDEVERTIQILDELIKEHAEFEEKGLWTPEYSYHASW
jgi:hypothetical protein